MAKNTIIEKELRKLSPSKRVKVTFEEAGHAYVDYFVENIRSSDDTFDDKELNGKDLAYWLGHIVSYIPLVALGYVFMQGLKTIIGT